MSISVLFQKPVTASKVYFAKILDVKAQGTEGGTFTSGAKRTRDLNTIEKNENGIILSLSNNQFELAKGDYEIEALVPASFVYAHKSFLYNVTDAAIEVEGQTANHYQYSFTSTSTGYSHIKGKFSIASTKKFDIQHQCNTTRATLGMGNSQNNNVSHETYTMVVIRKFE